MRRLTLAEALAPISEDREEADRSAAIAAMGYRLAAAGPRTRQRLLDRQHAQEQYEQEDWDGYRPSDALADSHEYDEAQGQYSLPFDCQPRAEQVPPLSARTIATRSAVIGIMAACGFGVVLVGYGREGVHVHHKAAHADISEAAAEVQPQAPAEAPGEPPVVTATIRQAALIQPAIPETAPLADPPAAVVPAQAEAAPPLHDTMADDATPARLDAKPAAGRPALRKQETPPPKPQARQTALAEAAPVSHPHGHPSALRATPVLFRPAEVKPHPAHPAANARIELPRWLTEDHPEHPKTPLVMSEPPHDLVAPAAPRHQAASQPRQSEPSPPARDPDTITAASSDAAPPPYHPPALRPGYGAPYPGYGRYYSPYGGYYGAAMAYAAPYQPPPGYGYGYRW